MTQLRDRLTPAVAWSALAVGVVLAFFILGAVLSALAPAPSGPALSSYATTTRGLAAWAELLERDGHVVGQIRQPLGSARLPADATLVILGSRLELTPAESRAVTRFVEAGGRLVINRPVRAHGGGAPGRVVGIPDPAFLENAQLARGENAARALAVAGPPSRPVLFDEVVHGYGPATGLAALPERWWFAFALLASALGAFALSRAIRLGGSDPVAPPVQSPRTAYVDAMAQTLARNTDRAELVSRVEQAAATEALFRESV